jgi:ketosteroid isomerase-like protein
MSIEDEFLIHKLVSRYADAVNRRDADAWSATWAEDAVWQLSGADETAGRERIVEQWRAAMDMIPFVVQLFHHGVVEVDRTAARGIWYFTERLKFSSDQGVANVGCYRDRYAKIDGEWLFTERRHAVLYTEPGDKQQA